VKNLAIQERKLANQAVHEAYANNSQRAVASYIKLLSPFKYIAAEGEHPVREQEQFDLHAFFQALYSSLYAQPEQFGLPVRPDASIAEDEPNVKDKKQEVKRLLDKPRAMLAAGVDFLMQAGTQSSMDGEALQLGNYPAILEQSKVGKKFLAGLESTGLSIALAGDRAVLTSSRFTAMMPALQALAKSCLAYRERMMGKFLFASCDFRALGGYVPQAMDLYRAFDGFEGQLVADLHAYFSDRNYKTEMAVYVPFAWVVKYQGDRKIKATPLFQIEYDDRYAHPLSMQIKCVSTARLAEIMPNQPQFLQDDFARRVTTCRGDACGWCRNQKTLGPTLMEIRGAPRSVCWYTNPDVRKFDERTIELIQQYEQMHALLAPEIG
jgi:hypothetical protein